MKISDSAATVKPERQSPSTSQFIPNVVPLSGTKWDPRAGKLMSVARQENQHSLTQYGYNLQEADSLAKLSTKDQIASLTREFESYELHVVRNHVVSLPYSYWLAADGKIFSNREQSIELELDKDERGGYYQTGISEALRLAKNNPNQLVFHYSPPGPASFDPVPDPKYAKPYNIGQLYLMYSDGDKVNNISISVSPEGELWLAEIFGEDYLKRIGNSSDQMEIIKNFITHPFLSSLSIDDFLNKQWQKPNQLVFKTDNLGAEKTYTVNDVLEEINNSLTGKLKPKINAELIAERIVLNGGRRIKEEDLRWAYHAVIGEVMRETGRNEIALGGGCGGSVVKSSDLLGYESPVEKMMEVPNLSSNYRRKIQGESSKDTFNCPSCNKPIPKGKGITTCPHCGISKEEYAKRTKQKKCD